MRISLRVAAVAMVSSAGVSRAQPVAPRIRTAADRALITALVAVEDSRDSIVRPTDPRRRGLAAVNPYIRAFTVRGLGRIESASLIPVIAPALADSSPDVRSVAADALAQAAVHGAQPTVRPMLKARLDAESDPRVRGALLEAIGRSAGGSAESIRTAATIIAPSLASRSAERRGAIRGIFFLSRKPDARPAGRIPAEVTDRVFAMLADNAGGYAEDDRVNLAATLTNVSAIDHARLLAMYAHVDPGVRDRAVAALARAGDTSTVRTILARAVVDSALIVRFRSVGVYARRLRAVDGCAPLVRLAHDRDLTVALAATDALAACGTDAEAIRLLDSLATAFKDGDGWHLATHAMVALSAANPRRARDLLQRFVQARSFFVRTYADSAARLLGDTATLFALAADRHPNVRTAAIAGLSALVGHAADSVYIAALRSDDNQLLMAASAALGGTTDPTAIVALDAAQERLAAAGRQTARDGANALQKRYLELGGKFRALGLVQRVPAPTFDELAAIERSETTIEMADGSIIRVRLHAFDAPTNAARFVRLARAHVFDGLTFHRVVPFFVVQGPSPNANEYSAPDGPFTRDELGRENLRGTIGLSTRGRDTGDGQIFVNTVDNTWLDHEYTVMGTITRGLDAFDRMQEGARIVRISVSGPAKP